MKLFRLLLCGITLFCLTTGSQAQDIHFSQFYLSPLNLNPAMTGVMNCNGRLAVNYRNQWSSILKNNAFSTYSASYDQKIPVGRYDYFGIGGTFWGDKAGEAEFATLTAKLSGSYSKRMGGSRSTSHYLVVGAEGGFAQRSIDFLAIRWGNQADPSNPGQFDPTQTSGEENTFDRTNFTFADMAAGVLWFSNLDRNNSIYFGGAFHHLNRADQSFRTEEEDFLYSRFTIHGGGEFMGRKAGLLPGFIVMKQGPSLEVNAGTSVRFLLGSDRFNSQSFQIGLWSRIANRYGEPTFDADGNQIASTGGGVLMDALIASTRFDYNEFSLGFSYDLNTSTLARANNGNGSFEFALLYKFCGSEKRGVYCPNF